MEAILKKTLDRASQLLVKNVETSISISGKKYNMPNDFTSFNKMIGSPIHPGTNKETEIFDYQVDYFNAWQKHHKLILNKSRKIGATETALRIIAYNCLIGNYSGHRVMIVAGNKQEVANRFIQRFKSLFYKGFTDLEGTEYKYEDIVLQEDSKSCIINNTSRYL